LTEVSRRPEPGSPDAPLVDLDGTLYPAGSQIRPTPGAPTDLAPELTDSALAFESGLELKARSQWAYARSRFLRHRLAMGSLVVLIGVLLCGAFAGHIASYSYDAIDLNNINAAPTTTAHHYFGTDQLGRDYFSRVLYGIRTSARVAFFVSILSTILGTLIGAFAGYFGGWLDNLLMRFTGLILTLPPLAVLLVAAARLGNGTINLGLFSLGQEYRVALILALLFWTGIARVVRGLFLSLREKEYVEAAKASGSGDVRIIFRHMLPNSLGPIIVNLTLITAGAILTESALSFLGFGIKPPTAALGNLIAQGETQMQTQWWLVVFPGLTIVIIVMCINFIGDGLRDALDPTQRRIRA
jgi:ABC-type dipeptide/oligopeptide/nickel transport system permease subunit